MLEDYNEILEDLKKHSHFRNIKNFENKDEKYIYFNGKKLINLSSNNYLGLADNKRITEAFLNSGGDKYSFGSASARLLTGTLPVYKELENKTTAVDEIENAESARDIIANDIEHYINKFCK